MKLPYGYCCKGCDVEKDCGKCRNCRDKPKFGGEGRRKKMCERRICSGGGKGTKGMSRVERAALVLVSLSRSALSKTPSK